jgi:hypothetical protein
MPAAVNIDNAIGTEVPSTRKDWAGAWFDILEEMGEFIGMRAGRLVPGAAQPAWEFHSHAGQDGLGWFTGLMRRERPHAGIAIPRMKNTKRPSVLAQVGALLQLVGRKPEAAARWNTFDAGWRPMPGVAVPGTAAATHAFAVEDTRRLNDRAASNVVSLNSLLLATLGRASAPLLDDGPAFWMMPVNMRGPVQLERDTANHTSYLQIRTFADTIASQVHEQVRARLSANEHWGGWLFANCGRIVRYAGMKWIFNRELARTGGRPWTGAFSNLGVWDDCGMWFVCPPVAKSCPLAVGVVICEGRLSLTIDAHPSIARDAAWTRALLNNWITELAA